ncbi:hypothetical protein OE88DRAFT_1659690 [Heliocybe sulcata]|uniref:Uncharacterized protein n=1 Tax=Heliocybe sulcata TaxID=5364 RepID=A0A5C3N3E3_9AGAM|nr:hypothetical protein OE88DRAFT_1659690 [Heliocybe sulcata]
MMKDYKVPEELKHYLPTPNSASTDVGQVNDSETSYAYHRMASSGLSSTRRSGPVL